MNNLKTLLARLLESARADFDPKPIARPKVDPGFQDLEPLLRSTEAIRFSILSLEFWVDPNGQLREWSDTTAGPQSDCSSLPF